MARAAGTRPAISVISAVGLDESDGSVLASLASLIGQSLDEWEWVVVTRGLRSWPPEMADDRVRVVVERSLADRAAAKDLACVVALGPVLVELDVGDSLVAGVLRAVLDSFEAEPALGLVYGDHATARSGTVEALDPYPHNVSWAPCAPRWGLSYRRSVYQAVGGYDASIGEMYEHDLLCRIFQKTQVRHVRSCFYVRRAREDPKLHTALAGAEAIAAYERYIEANALSWARREGLAALDLGVTPDRPKGYLGVAPRPGPGVDLIGDIARGLGLRDNSVGVVRAIDVLGTTPQLDALLLQLHRLLAHGGMIFSRSLAGGPAGISEATFARLTTGGDTPAAGCAPHFNLSRLHTSYPSGWHQERSIPYVSANLIAVKNGPPIGEAVPTS